MTIERLEQILEELLDTSPYAVRDVVAGFLEGKTQKEKLKLLQRVYFLFSEVSLQTTAEARDALRAYEMTKVATIPGYKTAPSYRPPMQLDELDKLI